MPTVTKTDEVNITLQILDQQMIGLINPANAAVEIEDALDHLHAQGASPEALDAIAENATDLFDLADHLRKTCQTAVSTARTLKHALDELKRGIKTCDTDIPEIDALREMLEDELMDTDWMSDLLYDDALTSIEHGSGLTWDDARSLWDVLTGGVLRGDSLLWDDLRAWMEDAEREARPAWSVE